MFLFLIDEHIASLGTIRQSHPTSRILTNLRIFQLIQFLHNRLMLIFLPCLWAIFGVHQRAPSRRGEVVEGDLRIYRELGHPLRERR